MTNTEKRKHTRVESLNLSYISIDHAGNVVNEGMGRTLNVSEAGILLESNFCALPDQTISLTLAIEEDLLDVKGKVIRCKELEEDLYHMGVEFLDLDSAARRTLSKFIAMFNDVQKTEISRTDKERSNFMQNVVIETDFPNLQLKNRGKVRDIYDLGDHLLMVASDRLSAFDVVLPDPIPDKGKILTRISLFWFDVMNSLVPNHVVSGDTETYPDICKPYAEVLKDRSMLVKKTEPLPIECVVRGYISGSGWKSYRESGTVCGIPLPEGLRESDKLPEPIFTPSTKAEMGLHDENIDFTEAVRLVGKEIAEKARDLSLAIYKKGVDIAEEKGIIIADTKFEFGLLNGEMILIDEVLTPDSSRFWPKESYRPGGPQQSYDKQYVRDYLKSLNWDKTPPAPTLPSEVIRNTRGKYLEALEQLTGVSHEF